MWSPLADKLSNALGREFVIARKTALGGGCINDAWRIEDADGTPFFVKANRADQAPVFEAEAAALEEMANTGTIRVPRPIICGSTGSQAYLVLEYIEFGRRGEGAAMGRQLAALHRHTAERFGWNRDNVIGSTPQQNGWMDDWIDFYRDRRLRPQLELAQRNGHTFHGADALLDRLPDFFEDYNPAPSLLHGDLWGGNTGYTSDGDPVIFDPASYYGDRETDLAMTTLFGGFGSAFYEAYDDAWPRAPGWKQRIELYNLYHILNHANLFGSGYASQAQGMIDRLR